MRYVKILYMPLSLGTRDRRELSVAREAGFECHVIAKEEPDPGYVFPEGVYVREVSTRPLGSHAPNALNRILSIFTWASAARKLKADAISGHDLPGLTAAWIATWFMPKKKRPALVYDCHEFTVGTVNRSRFNAFLIKSYERFLMKKCRVSIVVTDAIADMVTDMYKLRERPVVARNTPFYWQLDGKTSEETRRELCSSYGIPYDSFLVVSHGMISPARGIETLVNASAKLQNTSVLILGNGTEEHLAHLRKRCDELGVTDRVFFMPAVPNAELWRYLSACDAGIITIVPWIQNSYLSLPNKLFEDIQARIPIISSDLPYIAKIITSYDIGLLYEPENADRLAEEIERLRTDRELYDRFRKNLETAKRELCWEQEKTALKDELSDVYKELEARKKR